VVDVSGDAGGVGDGRSDVALLPRDGVRVWLTDAWIDGAAGPSGLGIQHIAAVDGSVVVRVVGELDLHSAPELRVALDRLAATTRLTVLDLSATRFIDCAGLGVVLHAARTSRARRWSFILARERSAPVTRLIELAGVGSALTDERHP
jgi:anti-anti-sigma factor